MRASCNLQGVPKLVLQLQININITNDATPPLNERVTVRPSVSHAQAGEDEGTCAMRYKIINTPLQNPDSVIC